MNRYSLRTVSVSLDLEPSTVRFFVTSSLGLIVMISSGGSHQFLYSESAKTRKFVLKTTKDDAKVLF